MNKRLFLGARIMDCLLFEEVLKLMKILLFMLISENLHICK